MKNFTSLIAFFVIFYYTSARADVCLLTDQKTAEDAISILSNENEIFEYCSTCEDAVSKQLKISDINIHSEDGSIYEVYINSEPVDIGHIYIRKNNRYYNLAIMADCKDAIKADIKAELPELKEKYKISREDAYKYARAESNKIFNQCHETFFKKQEYDFTYAINAAYHSNLCIEKKIKEEIKKLFNPEQKQKALIALEKISQSSEDLYNLMYTQNIYCENKFCGLDAELMATSEKTTLLRQILENLIFINKKGE